jgi:hypothetical protein
VQQALYLRVLQHAWECACCSSMSLPVNGVPCGRHVGV